MRRRDFITILGGAAAMASFSAHAQPPGKLRRVGLLMGTVASDATDQSERAAFREALAQLGWKEDSNIRTDVRWGAGDPTLYSRYAAELLALGAEVLVGEGTAGTEALRQQTSTVPIVFISVNDPIGQRFVPNLARPGGNITGFSALEGPAMAGKWLEMLTKIEPPVARIAVMFNPETAPYAGSMLPLIDAAAHSLRVAMQAAPVGSDFEIESVMAELERAQSGGLVVLASAFTVTHRDLIISLAARHRLPAVYSFPFFAAAGGLIAYGVNTIDLWRRSATYVDRILKGGKPGDLPVQTPTKFDLVINLKTAKALGVTIAPTLLATADEVIE
jgi:putative tryptophan/tyrosine transport system substrate-binding protein